MRYGCQLHATSSFTPQEIFLILISVRCWVNPRAIVRPKVYVNEKIVIMQSGNEPATIMLVAQRVKQLRHRVLAQLCLLQKRIYWIPGIFMIS